MKPKISIIVPIYNVEKYLERCLSSILNQTLKDIEVILVDDESPDRCPTMCDEYANQDSRIKVIHKKNGGLGFARNSGIEIASGEYIAFIDSDDWIDINMYETLYKIAIKEKLDAIYTEFNPKYYPGFHVMLQEEQTYWGKNEIEKLILDMVGPEPQYNSDVKFQVSVCKALYRLDLIKKYNILFHSERELISEDLIFNIDFLLKATKVKTTPIQMYYYWLNPSSLTHGYRPNLWTRLMKFYEYLLTRKNEFKDTDEYTLRVNRSVFLGIRSAINQEIRYGANDKKISSNIMNILNTPLVKHILSIYPINKMPIRHRIYYSIIKTEKYFLIKLFVKLFIMRLKK